MREIKLQWLNPNELIPYAKNAKLHPPDQIQKIAGQIHAFGFDQPIVVDKEMVIIKGHGRHLAATSLRLDKVPVVVADWLSEYDAMASRIADNKVSESEWDNDFLRFDLGTLNSNGIDLSLTGFDEEELVGLLNNENEIDEGEDKSGTAKFIVQVDFEDEGACTALYDEMLSQGYPARILKK